MISARASHVREFTPPTIVTQASATFTDVNDIAERLRDAREAAGLTQPQLAARAGVSPGTIGNIESGYRKEPRQLLAIAAALGVNAEWLQSGRGVRQAQLILHPVAHDLSQAQPSVDAPHLKWEDLMQGSEHLPAVYTLEVLDDSMAPLLNPGDRAEFDRTAAISSSRRRVLVRDNAGNHYIREYRERRPGIWQAVALNQAYLPLDSEADGLQVVAVMVGVKWK